MALPSIILTAAHIPHAGYIPENGEKDVFTRTLTPSVTCSCHSAVLGMYIPVRAGAPEVSGFSDPQHPKDTWNLERGLRTLPALPRNLNMA